MICPLQKGQCLALTQVMIYKTVFYEATIGLYQEDLNSRS